MRTKRAEADTTSDIVDGPYQSLAVFLKCGECDCHGFHFGSDSTLPRSLFTYQDAAEMSNLSPTVATCGSCRHTLSFHLESLRSVGKEDLEIKYSILCDYLFLCKYVNKYSTVEELQTLRDSLFPLMQTVVRGECDTSVAARLPSRLEGYFNSITVRKMVVALARNIFTAKYFNSRHLSDFGHIPDETFNAAATKFERNVKRCKFDENTAMKSIAEREADENKISVHVISNDLSGAQSNTKLVWLMQLQRLFCAQLPKMPEEYVTRVIFDHDHRSLVIHKEGKGIIGGICFRSFQQQGFIEIVFCAITADEQVKGYGTLMMNHLKDYQIIKCGVFHFLTYADEFAIGYFKKQGFITQIALPVDQYRGYIKDYQGATLMGCQLHPRIIYTRQKALFYNLREFYTCLMKSKCTTTERKFGGIEHIFREQEGKYLDDSQIPGLEMLRDNGACSRLSEPTTDSMSAYRNILAKLRADKNSWPFLTPVNPEDVPEYYETISYPIDLRSMAERLKSGYYVHERLFLADAKRMFANCYKFNAPESPYYMHGYKLNKTFNQLADSYFPGADLQAELPSQRPIVTSAVDGKSKKH